MVAFQDDRSYFQQSANDDLYSMNAYSSVYGGLSSPKRKRLIEPVMKHKADVLDSYEIKLLFYSKMVDQSGKYVKPTHIEFIRFL